MSACAGELLQRLNELDEHENIEAKTGTQVGTSFLETVSAFSNEPKLGGGYILVGVHRDEEAFFPVYTADGIDDPDKLQNDIATQCASALNRPVRPRISIEKVDGRVLLVVQVPEAPSGDKPIYLTKLGLPRGAYRRIGSSDQHCTEDDLRVLFDGSSSQSFDANILQGTSILDIDEEALTEYRKHIEKHTPQSEILKWNDNELLRALRCAEWDDSGKVRLTVAGLLLFGKTTSIRRCMPMARVDYIRVPGKEWVLDPDRRYESLDRRGPLMKLANRIWADILDDIPKAFSLPPGTIQRQDIPSIPDQAIREAVVNALIHCDYRAGRPIQFIRYSNRLEFQNPGFSLKAEDRLGEPGSDPRNQHIAAVFHETRFAETKGTGIAVMRKRMEQVGLSPPTFESDRANNAFTARLLFHHFLSDDDHRWLGRFQDHQLTDEECRALIFVREVGAIDNRAYRLVNGVDAASSSRSLRRLRAANLLDKKGHGSRTWYRASSSLLSSIEAVSAGAEGTSRPSVQQESGIIPQESQAKPQESETKPHNLPWKPQEPIANSPDVDSTKPIKLWRLPRPFAPENEILPTDLPEDLRLSLRSLGKKSELAEIRRTIRQLCSWQPMTALQLSVLLGRNVEHLRRYHLSTMVEIGSLSYVYPEESNHPKQGYVSTPETKESDAE